MVINVDAPCGMKLELMYLMMDIAITENGPVLIEANIMPGNRILQMPYVTDRIGKRSVMERFL